MRWGRTLQTLFGWCFSYILRFFTERVERVLFCLCSPQACMVWISKDNVDPRTTPGWSWQVDWPSGVTSAHGAASCLRCQDPLRKPEHRPETLETTISQFSTWSRLLVPASRLSAHTSLLISMTPEALTQWHPKDLAIRTAWNRSLSPM